MSIRTPSWLGLVLVLWSGMASASDGFKYAIAYLCDPEPVIEAAVEACRGIDSGNADRFKAAFQFWTSQNQSEIARLREQCADKIRKHASTGADYLAAIQAIARLNKETISWISVAIDGKSNTSGSYCAEYRNKLESETKDVWSLFP